MYWRVTRVTSGVKKSPCHWRFDWACWDVLAISLFTICAHLDTWGRIMSAKGVILCIASHYQLHMVQVCWKNLEDGIVICALMLIMHPLCVALILITLVYTNFAWKVNIWNANCARATVLISKSENQNYKHISQGVNEHHALKMQFYHWKYCISNKRIFILFFQTAVEWLWVWPKWHDCEFGNTAWITSLSFLFSDGN